MKARGSQGIYGFTPYGRAVTAVLLDGEDHDVAGLEAIWCAAGGTASTFRAKLRGQLRRGLLLSDGNGSVRYLSVRICGVCQEPIPGTRYATLTLLLTAYGSDRPVNVGQFYRYLCAEHAADWTDVHRRDRLNDVVHALMDGR